MQAARLRALDRRLNRQHREQERSRAATHATAAIREWTGHQQLADQAAVAAAAARRALLDRQVTLTRAAELCETDLGTVRHLVRLSRTER